jgi:hypothetical protein
VDGRAARSKVPPICATRASTSTGIVQRPRSIGGAFAAGARRWSCQVYERPEATSCQPRARPVKSLSERAVGDAVFSQTPSRRNASIGSRR